MTRRELVKAAIEHRETGRVPYRIDLCGDAWDGLKATAGVLSPDEFLDNDVHGFGVPWWNWFELEPDWSGHAARQPRRDKVVGCGDYDALLKNIKAERDKSGKYFLALIYGSHFEKAYFARGIENFLADMAGEPEFARRFLTRIIDRNMVMLENIHALLQVAREKRGG